MISIRPLKHSPQPVALQDRLKDRSEEKGEWVLVVDDEPSILDLTARTLQVFGYQVLVASGGFEAQKVYECHRDKIALVITDMMMPEGNGTLLILALLNVNPVVKIIALSGFKGANGDQIRAIGAKRFVPKPYTAQILIQAVREVLQAASGKVGAERLQSL